MANLVWNKDPALGPAASGIKEPQSFDTIAYHVQQAMQVMRDDPCGDLAYEEHCTAIYQLLAQVMHLLIIQPKQAPSAALVNDLGDVMGGCDGTTKVPEVSDSSSAPK